MALDGLSDDAVRAVLSDTRRIAMVGASDRPDRPSFGVLAWMISRGYDVTPVNPALQGSHLLGRAVAGTLAEAGPLDLVDVFRRSDSAGAVVDEAIRSQARAVWLQLGVVDHAAADRARRAGLIVVMDRCPKIEFFRLGMGNPRYASASKAGSPDAALNDTPVPATS